MALLSPARPSLDASVTPERTHDKLLDLTGSREIVIPHVADPRPVTAVRNVLIQSSLALLRACGYYERYEQLIAPDILAQLLASLGPGWVPITLAMAHYEACDNLMLSQEELANVGRLAGERLQETALISAAKKTRDEAFDLWNAMSALHRMWGRLYEGGSVQVIRGGPREKFLELRGFSLNRYRYYRQAKLGVIAAAYSALGPRISSVKVLSYSPKTDDLLLRSTW